MPDYVRQAHGDVKLPIQDIYEESKTQRYKLGTRLVVGDRVFRYAKAGAVALVRSFMTQSPVNTAHHKEFVIGVAAAKGAFDMTVGVSGAVLATAVVAHEYDEGVMLMNKVSAVGQIKKVKSHTAGTTPVLTLYDPLDTAIVATGEVTLTRNPFYGTLVFAKTTTGQPTGVPLIAVTVAYFYWSQVAGPAPIIVDTGDTVVLGHPVGVPSTNAVAGACGVQGTGIVGIHYGTCLQVGAAAEPALVNLELPFN